MNHSRRVVVWRSTEQERQRDPETGKTRAGCDTNQRSLCHEWFREDVFGHGVQNFEVCKVAILDLGISEGDLSHISLAY